jgi:GntR family transcriptional regulator
MKHGVGTSKAVQIARTLENEIKSGHIVQGDRLDSESALMRRFSVSRNTVRKGLETIARQGLITTRTGIGSFVTYVGNMINDERGWTLALSEGPNKIGTRVLGLWQGPASRSYDGIPLGTECLCVDRLRFLTDTGLGISLERSRLPWRTAFEGIPERGLVDGSLNKTLSQLSIYVQTGQEWANVEPALSDADAQIMGRKTGEPMLYLRRLTRSGNNSVVEHVESLLDPKYFGLHLEF